MIDVEATIERLEAELSTVDRRRDPHEHASLAYRLGLAHAESGIGDAAKRLETALEWYGTAIEGFDPRFEPVAHARVLNAAAAATRTLGRVEQASEYFARAAELLTDRGRDDERAASLNNLGLVRADLGDIVEAVEAFDTAIAMFSTTTDEGRRGRAASLVNKGMALAAVGTSESLATAITSYERSIEAVADDEAPYHVALAEHARGVAEMALAELVGANDVGHVERALDAFSESLSFFTRTGFPYQHSLAKHNHGRALLASAQHEEASARHKRLLLALAAVEDSVSVLDPRLHRQEWTQALHTLEEVERALESFGVGRSRRDQFVALFEMSTADERTALLNNRITRLLALPADARHSAMRELAAASARSNDGGLAYISTELTVLTELPNEHLAAALDARLDAHRDLADDLAEPADRALDQAVGDALNGPQRVFVRDFLAARGFERP